VGSVGGISLPTELNTHQLDLLLVYPCPHSWADTFWYFPVCRAGYPKVESFACVVYPCIHCFESHLKFTPTHSFLISLFQNGCFAILK
jgi:hypothetical protein